MIEQSVSLASNGTAKLPGYEQLVRFGYTKNRGVYRLHVDATGEWEGLAIRCFWHVPDGKDPSSSLVVDGYVDVPASVTAQPGSGCITFEGSDDTKNITSADLHYRVSANSGTEDGTEPEPGTPAWQQLVDAVHTDATAAEQAKTDAQTAAQQAGASAQKAGNALSDTITAKEDALKATKAAQTAASEAVTSAGSASQSAQKAADSLQELKDGIASGDFKGEPGKTGATPVLTIGTVSSGDKPSADITGTPENPVLNLILQPGPQGPAVALDTTLTHEGEAADAKATGDAISAVKARQNILIGTETGNPLSVDDAFPASLCGLTVYGCSTQDGTPTPDAPVPIVSAGDGGSVAVKVTGKNLLNPALFQKNKYQSFNAETGYYGIDNSDQYWITGLQPCLPSTAYHFNAAPEGGCFYDEKKNPIGPIGFDFSFKTPVKCAYYCVNFSTHSADYGSQIIATVSKPATYSPYHEQLLTLPTPNGLPGIPVTSGGNYTDQSGQQWVCDEVDLERGVKVQRVNAVDLSTCVITGSTNLAATKRLAIRLPLKGKDYTAKALCNRLPYFVSFTSDTIHFYVDTNNAQVFIPIGAKNPEEGEYILFYILDDPIETPLTPAEIAAYKALTMCGPDTVVQAGDGAGVKLDYQRDVNIAIKRIEDAVASMTTT